MPVIEREDDAANDAGKTGICRNAGCFLLEIAEKEYIKKTLLLKPVDICVKARKAGTDL